ncbi:MAG: zf-HC2 domain-containing protein [Bacteroidota bacterium]
MNHKSFKKMLTLLLYDELGPADREKLNSHLDGCEECRVDLERGRAFQSSLRRLKQSEISDEVLAEARNDLRAVLRTERLNVPFWYKVRDSIR